MVTHLERQSRPKLSVHPPEQSHTSPSDPDTPPLAQVLDATADASCNSSVSAKQRRATGVLHDHETALFDRPAQPVSLGA